MENISRSLWILLCGKHLKILPGSFICGKHLKIHCGSFLVENILRSSTDPSLWKTSQDSHLPKTPPALGTPPRPSHPPLLWKTSQDPPWILPCGKHLEILPGSFLCGKHLKIHHGSFLVENISRSFLDPSFLCGKHLKILHGSFLVKTSQDPHLPKTPSTGDSIDPFPKHLRTLPGGLEVSRAAAPVSLVWTSPGGWPVLPKDPPWVPAPIPTCSAPPASTGSCRCNPSAAAP